MATGQPDSEKTPAGDPADRALAALKWPMRLTLAGLWAERISRAFWPLWAILLATFAALAFGLHQVGPASWFRIGAAVVALAALLALGRGIWIFRRPSKAEALARLDASLPGRPIAALGDRQAIGAGDAASSAVWRVHLARMAERARAARPVRPDLRLSSRDPYSLRYVALTAAVMAALFGSVWRVTEATGLTPGPAVAMPGGPVWEGWARPPAYTGKPTIYLNDIPGAEIEMPVGTRIQIRVYGDGATGLAIEQDVAQVAPPPPGPEDGATPAVPQGLAGLTELTVSQSGRLAIEGNGGRAWRIIATPDLAPEVAATGEIGREADGRFRQGFTASDDYGVVSGRVTISLDLAAVPRRYGLEIAPEPVEPVTLDLPMPMKGKRDQVAETLIDDISETILSNMPVSMVFTVADAAGQEGASMPHLVTLPGRRFFDPMANAVIEMRRDILWNRENAVRASQILKAMMHRPDDLSRSKTAAKRLRVLIRDLDARLAAGPLGDDAKAGIVDELWQIAFMFEEGDLGSAYDRLQRAQDRLEEAIRNGASPEEIDQLMREMQQAMRDYTRELAEEAQRNPGQQSPGGQGQEITGDQLQQMLDEIQRLMEEGRTAEAMALMEELRQLMENLQVTQGQGGQGGQGQGNEAMRELGDTLRDQQGLSDDAYRDMQRGRDGEGQDPGALADRQRELRERLDRLQDGGLPGDGSEAGERGRRSLDRAEEAMREAERAMREGDLSGALDRQAEAMEAMRDGLRDFGEALAEEQGERREPGGRQEAGRPDPGAIDPLGRESGDAARIGSDRDMVQNDPDLRAQELLDEIRRRSGEAERPGEELDYLKRLLDLF
ncbi:DUF4175 domain-containing protein [Pseudogemmobacter sonorensis]|uniref:DUF4175 domain-containing protein n=1 Tax=Pseudogemmobacter sonorensis TaxID=2989681 RepID=UPI0036B10158